MKRKIRIAALFSAAVLTLPTFAACSVEEKTSQSDGALNIVLSAGLDHLDPQRSANGPDLAVMSQIYETLLAMDPKTRELKPHLAQSYELIGDTTWRFKLRQGVEFTNGEPFNAEAVKFSIERILDPETVSTSTSQLSTVKEVKVVDDYTVDVVTKYPDPVLPRRMQPSGGSGRVFIVPPKYFGNNSHDTVANKPIGTGPYKLETWNKGQSLTLVRNESYWGTKPEPKKATFSFIAEDSTRVNSLMAGEVDLIQRVPVEDVDRVNKAENVHVESSPDGLVHTLLLDMRKPPFDDLKVRQAFAHAIDVQGIVDQLLKGHGRVLGVPLGNNVVQVDKTIKPYEYDPAKARRLLQESGYNGATIETKTSEGRYVADKQIYDAFNKQLTDVGFKIKPQTVEWGRLINQMTSGSAGPFYIIGWDFGEGDASKADSFLKSAATTSIAELDEYDRLSEEASRTTDKQKNIELWQQAQKVVHDNYAVGAVWQADSIYGLSDKITWKPEFGDNLVLKDIKFK